ncbi:alpha-mannosidase [Clostridiales bacterium COT073_COT-073]|nr:alpha-mannosidase [Clostridiales bacterium COT073_COT-073]
MFFEVERIQKIVEDLKELITVDKLELKEIQKKDGLYHSAAEADAAAAEWRPFGFEERWGGKNKWAWFRTKFTIPGHFAGKRLVYRVTTSHEGEWDAKNPNFLIFVNNKLIQGLDVNHTEILLTENAIAGQDYTIDLQAFSGMEEHLSECKNTVCLSDPQIEQLYYDLFVPLESAKLLPKGDYNRSRILDYLTHAINFLDLRKPYNDSFYASTRQAISYLAEEFYGKYCGHSEVIANCVGHTHIDVAWLWDLEQTAHKVERSFSTVLELMRHYKEYIFMSSQPQLYRFLQKNRPELYAQVKERIKEGCWEPEGAMWLEADCNLSSGESLIRQIILGKRFFREEFGVESKILWLPDVFGYSAALPQILQKAHIPYFMTTKISWNEYNKMPYDTFRWVGLDGSSVLTHFITTANFDELPEKFFTTYNGNINANSIRGAWERYQQKELNNEVLVCYGWGDGGGGATKEMLEYGKRLSKGIPTVPKVEFTNSLSYFENLDKKTKANKKTPSWVGELYFEYHRGTLTGMARNKKYNRKSEFLYEEIEWLSDMAWELSGQNYPQKEINDAWEIICLNQFHDIIPGSSIKKVYDDSKEQYEQILADGKKLKENAVGALLPFIKTDGQSVVVFNPAAFSRTDVVSVPLPEDHAVYFGEEKASSYYCPNCRELIFLADHIPAKGYKVYRLKDAEAVKPNYLTISPTHLENEFLSITLDEQGLFTSIYDKKAGREVLAKGKRGNVLQAFEDRPHNWDAWDINIYYQEKMWEITDVTSISVSRVTPLKAVLKIVRPFMDSTITQWITIYAHTPRIDFETEIDWKEKQILLKAAFPVDIHAEKAVYDIQLGNVERPTHWNTSWDTAKFEVCGHKWADLSEYGYGVSILNDCKYGHDIKDNVMRLTLLKSAIIPNEDADREVHNFTYSLFPHSGDFRVGGVVPEAYFLNQPLHSYVVEAQDGKLPAELSFAQTNAENVVMEVVKKSEYTDELIVRVHECYNKRTKTTISTYLPITAVCECDLEERQVLEELTANGNTFTFEIKPFEIKTFKIKLAK